MQEFGGFLLQCFTSLLRVYEIAGSVQGGRRFVRIPKLAMNFLGKAVWLLWSVLIKVNTIAPSIISVPTG
jgi:hypothetical protein